MNLGSSIGLTALLSAKKAMDVIGHNLANQNTPGYSRQIALLGTALPVTGPGLLRFGTGVKLTGIHAVVNDSLLARLRIEQSALGRYAAETETLGQLESLLADLSESGLSARLQNLFDQADQAATAPDDAVLRSNLLSAGGDLALAFRQRAQGLDDLRKTSLLQAHALVATANQQLAEVATLNVEIQQQETVGGTANDLRDRRNLLMQQLAESIGARSTVLPGGQVAVAVNGVTLVSGAAATSLVAKSSSSGGVEITTAKGHQKVEPDGGRLGGLITLVESYLPGRRAALDHLARELIWNANRIHSKGVPATGPFQSLVASNAFQVAGGGSPDDVPLAKAGLPFDVQDGVLSIAVTDLASGDVARHEIVIDPETMTVSDLVDAFNAIPELSAFVDGQGKLHLSATPGHGFDFSPKLDPLPVEGGTFGAAHATLVAGASFPVALANGASFTVAVDGGAPQNVTINAADFQNLAAVTAEELAAVLNAQLTGASASVVDGRLVLASNSEGAASGLAIADGAFTPAAILGLPASATGTDAPVTVTASGQPPAGIDGPLTFSLSGDGAIGITPGLQLNVHDASGKLVTTLDVGEGYEPGSDLEVAGGLFVQLSAGAVQGSAGQFFALELAHETDSAHLLPALGMNALFTGQDAATFDVAPGVKGKPEALAGALFGAEGDGSNFLLLAALDELPVDGLGGQSLLGAANLFAAEVGSATAGAQSSFEATALVALTLEAQRQAESGVSPEEELLALQQFEQAYEAAAKYLSVVSKLEDVLLEL